jgi:hypothetical protein
MKNSLGNFYAFTFPHQDFLLLLKSYLLIIGIPGFFFVFLNFQLIIGIPEKKFFFRQTGNFFSLSRYVLDMSTICPRYVHDIRLRYIVHRIGQIYILINNSTVRGPLYYVLYIRRYVKF